MKQTGLLFTPDNYDKSARGIKVQTRRIMEHQPGHDAMWFAELNTSGKDNGLWFPMKGDAKDSERWEQAEGKVVKCPYGTVGDRLYCKEAHYRWGYWMQNEWTKKGRPRWRFRFDLDIPVKFTLDATEQCRQIKITDKYIWGWQKRSPLFMPKWAARLWLELTEVRVERLQSISEQDAIAEGVELLEGTMNPDDFTGCWTNYDPLAPEPYWNSPTDSYHSLWTSIHGPDSWQLNPWLWVLSYRRVEAQEGGLC